MSEKTLGPIRSGVALTLLLVVCSSAAAFSATVTVGSGFAALSQETTLAISLDEAPDGLAGFTITVSVSVPATAEITAVSFPGWAAMTDNSGLPADSFWMKAVDLDRLVEPGATDITLGTLTVRGDALGDCPINIVIDRADDDKGDPISASIAPGVLHVGGTAAAFRVSANGDLLADSTVFVGSFQAGSADLAEWVNVSELVEPGDVLELDPQHPGQYRKARGGCLALIAGVVSTRPGVLLGEGTGGNRVVLALVGIVPVKACAEGGAIEPGDLLVPASMPGFVCRWEPPAQGGATGCPLVGKALEPLSDRTGVILALLVR